MAKAKCVLCKQELRKDIAGIDAKWEEFSRDRWLCRECARMIAQRVVDEY